MPDITRNTTTVEFAPTGLLPVYNENIIVLSSPNKQSGNFKWLIDIYVKIIESGIPQNLKISSLVILPNPDGYGIIDVHRHIESKINSDFTYDSLGYGYTGVDNNREWYIDVTEQMDNLTWRFEDNQVIGTYPPGNLAFITSPVPAYPNFSDESHPFKVGDVVIVEQDPGFTHASYNGEATIISIPDDKKIVLDKDWLTSTTPEGGVVTLKNTSETRTIYQSDIENNDYISWIGVQGFNEFRNWNSGEYNLYFTSPKKFLSNIPTSYDVNVDSNVWLNTYSESNHHNGYVITTNKGSFFYSLPDLAASFGNQIKRMKLGPKDILDAEAASINGYVLSGSLPAIDSNTTSIEYYAAHGNPGVGITRVTPIQTLNIVDKCSKYEKVNLFYMDRFGSFLPITFDRVSRTTVDSKRSNYYQNFGSFDDSTSTWGYNSFDRGSTTYDIVSTKKMTVTTDWLDETETELVQILLRSPEVYYLHPDGDLRAINITTNSYEEKKKVTTKLINYTISFEYSQNDRNQRA
tara:strand:- start:15605 stop:17164 length:1560 start_codon:yes stop_codon:yes gene_type:complete